MPKYYGYVCQKDREYIIIEYIIGQTLEKYDLTTLNDYEKYEIIFQLGQTIKYFHSKEHVYRDFKLDNIIIDANKNGILIDFDRLVDINEQKTENLNSEFLSPEYFTNKKYSYEDDFISLGCITFYLFIGEKPKSRNRIAKLAYFSLKDDFFNFGKNLFENKSNIQDIGKAIFYYKLAANQNDPNAQLDLGVIYYEGKYITRDIDKAIHYLKLAANQNNSSAQYKLGIIYYSGEYITRDINKSIHYLSLAANQNNSKAQCDLGTFYYSGEYITRDINKSIHYLALSANQNDSDAQHILGFIYYEGKYVTQDINKSIHYWTLAANQNNSKAQYRLGFIYYFGDYITRDINKSIHYFSLAASQNHRFSQYVLGCIYYEGLYVDYDIEKAIHYFKEVSCFNNQYAKNNLGIIYKTGQGVEANPSGSIVYFEEAIRQKSDEVAMFNLAHIYFYEEAGISNLDKAIELLVKSSLQNTIYSLDLLCLAVIKKYESPDIFKIEKDFSMIDIENSSILSEKVIQTIESLNLMESIYYDRLYDILKKINLVYYGTKIENQTRKKKIEIIDHRPVINEFFYEGLGDIEI